MSRKRGSNLPRLLAIFLTGLFVLSLGVVLTQHVGPTEVASAISLNFGANPVSSVLNVSFSRVTYLTQPTQWNTTGFINGTLDSAGPPYWHNSSSYGTHYAIAQFNTFAAPTPRRLTTTSAGTWERTSPTSSSTSASPSTERCRPPVPSSSSRRSRAGPSRRPGT